MFTKMQEAFDRAAKEGSVSPIHMFYREWAVIVGIERHPDVARRLHEGPFELLVHEDDTELTQLALHDDFAFDEELSGTTWMDAALRPSVERSEGFRLVDRSQRPGTPHPMIKRNGASIEARLNECSLYDPALDLAV